MKKVMGNGIKGLVLAAIVAITICFGSFNQAHAAGPAQPTLTRYSNNAYYEQLQTYQPKYSLNEVDINYYGNGVYVYTSSLVLSNDGTGQ